MSKVETCVYVSKSDCASPVLVKEVVRDYRNPIKEMVVFSYLISVPVYEKNTMVLEKAIFQRFFEKSVNKLDIRQFTPIEFSSDTIIEYHKGNITEDELAFIIKTNEESLTRELGEEFEL